MTKIEGEPRASVEARCDGEGGEEHCRMEIAGNGNVQGVIAGSITPGGGLSVEKSIREARFTAATVRPSQLTIFYGGSVSVFDGIPVEKVHEILSIAAAANATETKNSTSISPVPSPSLNRAPSFSSTSTVASPAAQSFPIQPISFCRSAADLPIARRHSLQRFLEKRRDRLVNKNPYIAPTTKKVEVQADNADTSHRVVASIKEEYPSA